MMVLWMLDGTVVKLVSLKKSVQKIVCYFVADTWAPAKWSCSRHPRTCCPIPQNFVIVCNTNYKILTQHIVRRIQCVVLKAGRRTEVRRTEIHGQKSNGRKSAAQCQRSPRCSSPVSFMAMAMATWSCSDASSRCYSTASSQRCNTASSQRYNAATRVAAVLRRCCSTRRDNAVAARIATALLQQALRQRCGAALARVATTLRRCSSSQQRRKAAHYATMASGSSARGNNR